MITRIEMANVATFSDQGTSVSISKPVSLFYGINGSGKSTIANFLSDVDNEDFNQCSVCGVDDECTINVYNTEFIKENYGESELIPGVFTLSKSSKEIEKKIGYWEKAKEKVVKKKDAILLDVNRMDIRRDKLELKVDEAYWRYKQLFSDSQFKFLLGGHGGKKKDFRSYIRRMGGDASRKIDEFKSEVMSLQEEKSFEVKPLEKIKIQNTSVYTDSIWSEIIVSAKDFGIPEFYRELGNEEWVKKGTHFIGEGKICPFCQQMIHESIFNQIKGLLDDNYDKKIDRIERNLDVIKEDIKGIKNKINHEYSLCEVFCHDSKAMALSSSLISEAEQVSKNVMDKIKEPECRINIDNILATIDELNEIVNKINIEIERKNSIFLNIDKYKAELKEDFAKSVFDEVEPLVDDILKEIERLDNKASQYNKVVKRFLSFERKAKTEINSLTRMTKSTAVARDSINNRLEQLGINGFRLESHDQREYALSRGNSSSKVFASLSEGEKTIITFLYFLEVCKGTFDDNPIQQHKKVIVVDDPISSLSHNYVYEVAYLIEKEFLKKCGDGGYSQCIILTHNLYFFHELYEHCKGHVNEYEVFEIYKDNSSKIIEMDAENISNEYCSYWKYINRAMNEGGDVVLLANAMRNVLEMFFSFIGNKNGYKDVLSELIAKDSSIAELWRFMNRGSHSDAINWGEYQKVDKAKWHEIFKNVFFESGYKKHYQKMSKC